MLHTKESQENRSATGCESDFSIYILLTIQITQYFNNVPVV